MLKYVVWLMTIIMLALRLAEVSTVSWLVVFAPVLIYYSVWICLLGVLGLIWMLSIIANLIRSILGIKK